MCNIPSITYITYIYVHLIYLNFYSYIYPMSRVRVFPYIRGFSDIILGVVYKLHPFFGVSFFLMGYGIYTIYIGLNKGFPVLTKVDGTRR